MVWTRPGYSKIWGLVWVGLLVGFQMSAVFAQNFVEILQDSTPYNYSSTAGVPLSGTVGNPVGSDGRIPVGGGGTILNQPTLGQFEGIVSF